MLRNRVRKVIERTSDSADRSGCVSEVTVFNFTVPVFGAALSALFLGEALWAWKNLLALVLVCAGIWLVTRDAPPAAK